MAWRLIKAASEATGKELADITQIVINQGFGTPKQSIDIGGSLDLSSLTPEQVRDRLAHVQEERRRLEEGEA